MLRPDDDLMLVHQLAAPLATVNSTDPRWMDRFWFYTGDVQAPLVLITGMGAYANADVLDGYAMLAQPGRQHNVRLGRPLSEGDWQHGARGLSYRIEDPMRHWRMTLDSDVAPVGFDFDWYARYPPHNMPPNYVERDGQVIMDLAHFHQAGEMTGSITVEGRRVPFDASPSERDRSWGVRPASGRVSSGIHVWLPAQAGERSLWLWFRESSRGERRGLVGILRAPGEAAEIVDVEHRLTVEEVNHHRILREGSLRLTLDDGRKVDVRVEPVLPVFLAGGGYSEGDRAQGKFTGADYEVWDTGPDGSGSIPWCIIDHFSRVWIDGVEGQGVFELSIGRYGALGFTEPPDDNP